MTVTVNEYARWFREHAASLKEKDKWVGDFIVRHEADLVKLLEDYRLDRWEDGIQNCILHVVEGVREAEKYEADFNGPMRELWYSRILRHVREGIVADRVHRQITHVEMCTGLAPNPGAVGELPAKRAHTLREEES